MNATTTVVRLDDIYNAMRECFRKAVTTGRNWHAVTVGVDGVPYVREEVSRCVSPAEYRCEDRPHPVTVWIMSGDASLDADQIDSEVEAFDPAEQFEGNDLVEKLEAAGFAVSEDGQ